MDSEERKVLSHKQEKKKNFKLKEKIKSKNNKLIVISFVICFILI
jgi:hypothetical protein